MKRLYTLIISLIICFLSFAENAAKTVAITEAGTLTALLTSDEKSAITNLIITGNIDARDVRCMRIELSSLSVLDLSGATIVAYNGSEGTALGTNSYPQNEMPEYSFFSSTTNTSKTTLTSIVFPESITSIGGYSFYDCSGLTKAIFFTNLDTIGNYAFFGCSYLVDFSLPNSLNTISSYAFYNCSSYGIENSDDYTNLHIPNSVSTIEENAFGSMYQVQSITGGDSVTSIGRSAFEYIIELETATIGSLVSNIPDRCFFGCSKLTAISILNKTPSSLGENSFYNCSSLDTVFVPATSVNNYKSSSYWGDFYSLIYPLQNSSDNYAITVNYGIGGGISNNEISISSGSNIPIDSGSVVTFNITPITNYIVDSLSFNAINVLDNLINNQYITNSITKNSNLFVSFFNTDTSTTVKDTICVYDTIYVNIIDTSYVNIYDTISILDSVLVQLFDTTFVNINDTTIINIYDTIPAFDSVLVQIYDTIQILDTAFISVFDTILNYDTVLVNIYDTISVTDTLYIDIIFTGIYEANTTYIKVYPNPVTDILNIDFGDSYSDLSNYSIAMISTDGKSIYYSQITESLVNIDLSDLTQPGLYFLQIIDNNTGKVKDLKKIILR